MRLVVIGGVAAGLSAAARARRIDAGLEILVLEKGETISYGACGLPYYIEGRVRDPGELIVYTPEYFRKERNITVRTRAAVAGIAHARREVSLEGFQTRLDQSSQVLARCVADDGPTPSEAAAERETAVRLADTLARLPEDYQTVLLLRVFEGLPAEEVARRMNRSAGFSGRGKLPERARGPAAWCSLLPTPIRPARRRGCAVVSIVPA